MSCDGLLHKISTCIYQEKRDMKMEYSFLVQEFDDKGGAWCNALRERGHSAIQFRNAGNGLFSLFRFLYVRKKIPDMLVIRYLNCRKSKFITILFAISEIALYFTCHILRVKCVWICHNVDRESFVSFPWISSFRRWMACKASNTVLVTHSILVPHAFRLLPLNDRNVKTIAFGPPDWVNNVKTELSLKKRIIKFSTDAREKARQELKIPLIGLCAGRPGRKYIHFDLACDLVSCDPERFSIYLICIGNLDADFAYNWHPSLKTVRSHNNVLFIGKESKLNEHEMLPWFDFIWRGYLDLSISYSVVTAISLGKPVLAIDSGAVGLLVKEEGHGATVKKNFEDIDSALEKIYAWGGCNKNIQLAYSWDKGAESIIEILK